MLNGWRFWEARSQEAQLQIPQGNRGCRFRSAGSVREVQLGAILRRFKVPMAALG